MAIISFENEKLAKTARDEIAAIANIMTVLALLDTSDSIDRVIAYVNHYVRTKKP